MANNSRTAAKFVVRFDEETTRETAADEARKQHISLNSFVLQAIDEKLARGKRLDKLLDLAAQQL